MSNFLNIGFNVVDQPSFESMILRVVNLSHQIDCNGGQYLQFVDPSGASFYTQTNTEQHIIGGNPHFEGQSSRPVKLTKAIPGYEGTFDGAFYAWANPYAEQEEDSGDYPFVFELPDYRIFEKITLPLVCNIQLTAFARPGVLLFPDEKSYLEDQTSEMKFAPQSFIPSGLFHAEEGGQPTPEGIFTGAILAFELKTNQLTGLPFYWLLVETLGGPVDVVAASEALNGEPVVGGILQGSFWLSARLLNVQAPGSRVEPEVKQGFFKKLFGLN